MTNWEEIIREYSPAVWRTVYRLVGDREDAADCVQETFLTAVRSSKAKSVDHWGAYLHKIAASRALDCLRKRYRTAGLQSAPPDWSNIPDLKADPQGNAQLSELVQKTLETLTELPTLQAEVFCLRYLAELDYRDIAESLEINPNSVGALLHRARESLRMRLSPLVAAEEFGRSNHDC